MYNYNTLSECCEKLSNDDAAYFAASSYLTTFDATECSEEALESLVTRHLKRLSVSGILKSYFRDKKFWQDHNHFLNFGWVSRLPGCSMYVAFKDKHIFSGSYHAYITNHDQYNSFVTSEAYKNNKENLVYCFVLDKNLTKQDETKEYFIFGSNLSGLHIAGSAKTALDVYNAVYGVGEGVATLEEDKIVLGRSSYYSYAFPTLTGDFEKRSIEDLKQSVDKLVSFMRQQDENTSFVLTKVGCGIAGYPEQMMIDLFDREELHELNCKLAKPPGWYKYDED